MICSGVLSCMAGEKARVVAMPTLEITADNIECSHGASVADLDENSMFYLAARGVSRMVVVWCILFLNATENVCMYHYEHAVGIRSVVRKLNDELDDVMLIRRRGSCCCAGLSSICFWIVTWLV